MKAISQWYASFPTASIVHGRLCRDSCYFKKQAGDNARCYTELQRQGKKQRGGFQASFVAYLASTCNRSAWRTVSFIMSLSSLDSMANASFTLKI